MATLCAFAISGSWKRSEDHFLPPAAQHGVDVPAQRVLLMKRTIASQWIGCFLYACTSSWAMAAESPDEMAQSILSKAGIRVGVCEIPRVGDGLLAAALARQGIAHVHALAPDVKAAESARKPSADSGMLGSRVIVETGSPAALPLGDWVADLCVVADATDANLKMLPASEMARVLAPYRGIAVVGNPIGGQSGLTQNALSDWAKGTRGTATIHEDATGLWAVIKMPPLKGGERLGAPSARGGRKPGLARHGILQRSSGTAMDGQAVLRRPLGHPRRIRMFTAQSSVFQHPQGLPYETGRPQRLQRTGLVATPDREGFRGERLFGSGPRRSDSF